MIFQESPNAFAPKFQAVGCFVECQGKILLLHRQPHKFEGGKWGLPAGKMDGEETELQGVLRELQEETGIVAREQEVEYLTKVFVRYGEDDFLFHMYRLKLEEEPDIRISPNEHQAFQWATPPEALEMNCIHDLDACIRMFY